MKTWHQHPHPALRAHLPTRGRGKRRHILMSWPLRRPAGLSRRRLQRARKRDTSPSPRWERGTRGAAALRSGLTPLRPARPCAGHPRLSGAAWLEDGDGRADPRIKAGPGLDGGGPRSADEHVPTLFLTDDASLAIGGSVLFPEGRAREASQEAGAGHGLAEGLATLATRGPGCAPGLPAAPGQASSEEPRLS